VGFLSRQGGGRKISAYAEYNIVKGVMFEAVKILWIICTACYSLEYIKEHAEGTF